MKPIPFVSARLTPGGLSAALIGFIVLVCTSLILATAWQMKQSADERLADAERDVANIVNAAEQQAQDTIRQADYKLRDIVERVESDGMNRAQQLRLHKLMAEDTAVMKSIQGFFIYDEYGNWIANSFSPNVSKKNNSDRDYFIYHRENNDDSIHIGSIVTSRTTGEMVIPVSRRIEYPDGRFAGVALATISAAYFQRFFERMEVDDTGVIFLALENGDLLARRPAVGTLVVTNISRGEIFSKYLSTSDSGTAIMTSVVDDIERIYAYRRLQGLPMVAAAGFSYDYVFANWWIYAYRSFAIVGLIISALTLLGVVLYSQVQKMLAAEKQLTIARSELEVLAQTDSLTNVANRRCFDAALQKEEAQARRSGQSIGLILLDIDWFKQYNDTYGHVAGDQCLKQVARLIQANIRRPADLLARYGGEEFIVLLPDTDLAGASNVAENIRSAIFAEGIEHSGSPLNVVSISGGVVAARLAEGERYAANLSEADRLLYRAKSRGRNRVETG
ncbi:diguanylate cyclase [Pseudomonas cichorii]|uniref:sensor domain-containing diguanylate cyclase n=1 Tax=Pseudomonas cichorii TaxID=36746 RepID=UPI0018E60C09|nr:sensor domain-containing diguanylate cyclase [Pseudomonas cichorii]MBI6853074.1 diguanylate cyclase [Pseudomonas cichorii]